MIENYFTTRTTRGKKLYSVLKIYYNSAVFLSKKPR
uniref:Transposase n=1 Tax=Heterorhabditis bacteriophora TaxID=37862 RepID=A0A1I7WBF7_HETBA